MIREVVEVSTSIFLNFSCSSIMLKAMEKSKNMILTVLLALSRWRSRQTAMGPERWSRLDEPKQPVYSQGGQMEKTYLVPEQGRMSSKALEPSSGSGLKRCC